MRARLLCAVLLLSSLSASAAITGTVMNADGQPVTGARISAFPLEAFHARLQRLASKTPERAPLASAQSDAKGNFTIDPGKDPIYALRVEAAGYAPSGRTAESGDDLGGIALTVAAAKKGKITAGGKPVAGAAVVWQGRGTEMVATTDAEGTYSVPDPAKWGSLVTILHPDFAVTDVSFDRFSGKKTSVDQTLPAPVIVRGRVMGDDGTTPAAGATITADGWPVATTGDDGSFSAKVAPKWEMVEGRSGSFSGMRARSSLEPVAIRLARAPVVSGIVRDARSNAPLPGVEVSAARAIRGPRLGRMSIAASTLTDAKGQFSLVVQPGDYQLLARRAGYDFIGSPVAVTGGQKLAKNVTGTQLGRVSGLVADEMKQPAVAASVSAEDAGGDRDPMNRRRMFVAPESVTSAPDGRFSIYVDPDSDVQLIARKKGVPEAKSATIRLAPGERRRGMTLTIPRGYAVTGRVVDRNGKPLSGVAVSFDDADRGGGRGGMIRRTIINMANQPDDQRVESAGDGTFTLRVREGEYDFTFAREGFAPKSVRALRVAANTAPLEVTMEPGTEIAGRVVREGAGVEGVTVNALAEPPQSATTGGDGSFRLADLPPGQVMLLATKPDEFIQQTRSVTAPDGDVVFEIPAGGRISGRVVDKTTRKAITSFQAGVAPQRGGGMMMIMSAQGQRTFTSDDGTFVLENVPAGAVQLTVGAGGYVTARVPNLTVEAGKTVSDVEVALDTGVRLLGKVVGQNGTPLSGVSVRPEGGRGPARFIEGQNSAFTDAVGEYSIEAIEPGEKIYAFSHPRYLSQQKTVNLTGRETRLDVTLSAGQRVTGVVVTESGAPVSDAEVRANSAADSSGREARTDANGNFSFESLAPANYNFFASKSGYASGTIRDFDIRAGAAPRIVLTSGGVIYGRVLGLQESEKANAQVIVSGPGSGADGPVDASGNFRIEGTPVGTVRVYASTRGSFAGGRESAWKSVEVTAGTPAPVDLEFNTGTTIRGRVTRGGRALPGAIVRFDPRSATAQTRGATTADNGGNYEVTGLDDGSYVVAVMDTERGSANTVTYDVRGSATLDIDVKTTTVRGRVVDSTSRQPVEQAEVQLRPSSSEQLFGMRGSVTDASGTFVIENVSPGTYTVRAQKTGYGHDTSEVTVGEQTPPAIELELSSSSGITLTVIDARTGATLTGSAYVVDAQNRVVNEGFFDSTPGPVRVSLGPGQYRATVSARGYASRTLSVTAPSEQTVGLTPGGSLLIRSKSRDVRRGRLIDAAGQAHQPRGSYFPIDASPGVATVRFIAPGVYTLQVVDDNNAVVASVPGVVVSEGATTEVEV